MTDQRQTAAFAGKRALVMGLGVHGGGLGVARFLAQQGALVTVTDLRDAAQLAEPMRQLADLPIQYVLGEHRESDFTTADLVVRNPAVPRESPLLAAAQAAGVPVEMEMSLFFRLCPAPIIGITGTKGKTTTASLCGAILSSWRADTVIAGNMGVSALEQLPQITPTTPVVIELSSWQLEGLAAYGRSPHIAVVTNLSPDHLNRYSTMETYAAAKRGIVEEQGGQDYAILNADDPLVWAFRNATPAQILPFASTAQGGDSAWLAGDTLCWSFAGQEYRTPRTTLRLLGVHNALNALAAGMAALALGASFAAVEAGLAGFQGVKDRMEPLGKIGGVTYINDTTATAPAAAAAAVSAMNRPTILIAGGSEKQTDFADFAATVAPRVKAVVTLRGDSTPRLTDNLLQAGLASSALFGPYNSMDEGVAQAQQLAVPGDVILLSPACASFGMFRNEFHRGDAFRAAFATLAAAEKDR